MMALVRELAADNHKAGRQTRVIVTGVAISSLIQRNVSSDAQFAAVNHLEALKHDAESFIACHPAGRHLKHREAIQSSFT